MCKMEWIFCPICGSKTRDKIREDTELKNFPLFCPKCKQETIVNVQQMNMTVIKEPDAQPITLGSGTYGFEYINDMDGNFILNNHGENVSVYNLTE